MAHLHSADANGGGSIGAIGVHHTYGTACFIHAGPNPPLSPPVLPFMEELREGGNVVNEHGLQQNLACLLSSYRFNDVIKSE